MSKDPADIHRALSAPIIAINWQQEVRSLRASDSYRASDHAARTLAKHSAMRIVLVAMKAGGRMEEHHADSDISVHCLHGAFRFEVAGTAHELEAGLVLVVAERLPHTVVAVDECAFLLTIGEKHGDAREAGTG
jgi:quercetin dioxygenase-like cupin family protein